MDKQLFDECKKMELETIKQENCIKEICSFNNEKIEQNEGLNNVINEVKGHNLYKYRDDKINKGLWVIYGKPKIEGIDNKQWICLEVGSSKDIKKELIAILRLMISESKEVPKHSAFFENVFNFTTYLDRTSVKYRKLNEICSEFAMFEVDIENYVYEDEIKSYNTINFAEVKYAFKHKALFWNPSPSVHGNQENKILREVFLNDN